MSNEAVTVHILDRDYQIACQPEERQGLLNAAHLLDRKMKEIRNATRSAGLDRIAVLAALNFAFELQNAKDGSARSNAALDDQLAQLKRKLDASLAPFLK